MSKNLRAFWEGLAKKNDPITPRSTRRFEPRNANAQSNTSLPDTGINKPTVSPVPSSEQTRKEGVPVRKKTVFGMVSVFEKKNEKSAEPFTNKQRSKTTIDFSRNYNTSQNKETSLETKKTNNLDYTDDKIDKPSSQSVVDVASKDLKNDVKEKVTQVEPKKGNSLKNRIDFFTKFQQPKRPPPIPSKNKNVPPKSFRTPPPPKPEKKEQNEIPMKKEEQKEVSLKKEEMKEEKPLPSKSVSFRTPPSIPEKKVENEIPLKKDEQKEEKPSLKKDEISLKKDDKKEVSDSVKEEKIAPPILINEEKKDSPKSFKNKISIFEQNRTTPSFHKQGTKEEIQPKIHTTLPKKENEPKPKIEISKPDSSLPKKEDEPIPPKKEEIKEEPKKEIKKEEPKKEKVKSGLRARWAFFEQNKSVPSFYRRNQPPPKPKVGITIPKKETEIPINQPMKNEEKPKEELPKIEVKPIPKTERSSSPTSTVKPPILPTLPKPTESKPTESKPTESKPTESKPTESKPTESKPTAPKSTTSTPLSKPTVNEKIPNKEESPKSSFKSRISMFEQKKTVTTPSFYRQTNKEEIQPKIHTTFPKKENEPKPKIEISKPDSSKSAFANRLQMFQNFNPMAPPRPSFSNRPTPRKLNLGNTTVEIAPNPIIEKTVDSADSHERKQQRNNQVLPKSTHFIVVVDTNCLLGSEISDLMRKSTCYIIIPYIVIQELDGLKRSNNEQLASAARGAIRFLEENFKKNHPFLRGQKIDEILKKDCPSNDDKILDCCLYFKNHVYKNTKDVVLLTCDRNLSVKAMVHSIESKTPEELLKKKKGDKKKSKKNRKKRY